MVDILLSLKWDGHKTAFLDSLNNFREKSSYTDATLAVEGKFYPVHKLVLSSCSQYLCDIFESTPCKSPVIVLKDVRSNDIEALLDYIYLGEVNINQNCLESFMKTAESLSIKGLASLVINNDPTKTSQIPSRIHVDACDGSPPPKKRRHDSSTALYKHLNTQTKKLLDITSNIDQDEPPIVKVEMEDVDKQQVNVTTENSYEEIDDIEKHEEDITREMSYEIDDIGMQEENITMENSYYENTRVDQDHSGYYGSDLSNTQHEPENVGNNSFLAPSVQQNLERKQNVSEAFRLHPGQHFPVAIGQDAKGKDLWRQCHFCNKQTVKSPKQQGMKKPQRSSIKCLVCNVALCTLPCFRLFHSVEDYVNFQKRQNHLETSNTRATGNSEGTDSEPDLE